MDLTTTAAVAAAALCVALFCGWRGAAPPDLTRGPRLIPYRLLMLGAFAAFLMLARHLLSLVGVQAGHD